MKWFSERRQKSENRPFAGHLDPIAYRGVGERLPSLLDGRRTGDIGSGRRDVPRASAVPVGVGAGAGELIAEAVTVLEFGGSAEDLGKTVHAHPTTSEALKEAALAVDNKALSIPPR